MSIKNSSENKRTMAFDIYEGMTPTDIRSKWRNFLREAWNRCVPQIDGDDTDYALRNTRLLARDVMAIAIHDVLFCGMLKEGKCNKGTLSEDFLIPGIPTHQRRTLKTLVPNPHSK